MNSEERNPLNFTVEEWQQAKRTKQDPRAFKEMFQECWAVSETRATFASALEERGFYLAKGDRRGHIAIDWQGEVYAISRYVGVKAKDVSAHLGDADDLLSVDEVIPFYRQAEIYARQGITLDRVPLGNWVGRACFHLRPIANHLWERMKSSDRVFMDETRAPVLDPGRRKTKTGYFWPSSRMISGLSRQRPQIQVSSLAPFIS